MNKFSFRYHTHPGDLLRNTDIVKLPDLEENLEDFLIWFLDNYQSDQRVADLDDLYKLLNNEFYYELEKEDFIERIEVSSEKEIKEKISRIEVGLKEDAFENFYYLLMHDEIELFSNISNVME